MVEKVLEIVGVSDKGFAEAAQDAVAGTAKTVRNIRWATIKDMDCKVENNKIVEYHVLMRIYFDVER